MIEHVDNKTDKIDVLVTSFVGNIEVKMTSKGSAFELSELENRLQLMDDEADAVVTLIVAKSEKQVDLKTYAS